MTAIPDLDAVARAPRLDLHTWSRPACSLERRLLADARGPVLDIGCGPGRLVAALHERGIDALGIDATPNAHAIARANGVDVLTKSVFDRLPGEGRWRTVLLLDGNIGIGGDPDRLLGRVRQLIAPNGRVLVEVDGPECLTRHGLVQLEVATDMVGWFPWSWVAVDDLEALASEREFAVAAVVGDTDRWFAWLAPL